MYKRQVIKLEGRKHPVKGIVIPLLAVTGALVIFFGALGKPILLLYQVMYEMCIRDSLCAQLGLLRRLLQAR